MSYQSAYVYIAPNLKAATLPDHCYQDSIDVAILRYGAMTVEQARHFVETAREKPMEQARRTVVLEAAQMSDAVQNTLLKILEEPPVTTAIYIVIPRLGMLLPTVRSRVQIMQTVKQTQLLSDPTQSFLAASPATRIQQIATWHKQKDTNTPRQVVNEVAIAIAEHRFKADLQLREALNLIESYIHFPGASVKMLLEELALSLPANLQPDKNVNQTL